MRISLRLLQRRQVQARQRAHLSRVPIVHQLKRQKQQVRQRQFHSKRRVRQGKWWHLKQQPIMWQQHHWKMKLRLRIMRKIRQMRMGNRLWKKLVYQQAPLFQLRIVKSILQVNQQATVLRMRKACLIHSLNRQQVHQQASPWLIVSH